MPWYKHKVTGHQFWREEENLLDEEKRLTPTSKPEKIWILPNGKPLIEKMGS